MGQTKEMLVHGRSLSYLANPALLPSHKDSTTPPNSLKNGTMNISMEKDGGDINPAISEDNYEDPGQADSCSLLSPLLFNTKLSFPDSDNTEPNEDSDKSPCSQSLANVPSIPDEYFKTFLSSLFLASGFVSTTISLALTHDKVPDTDPLPDVVLDIVKYWLPGLHMSEILLIMSTLVTGIVVLLHNHRSIILRRIWIILGILYYYRAITMFITVLPKADTSYPCEPKSNNTTVLIILKRVFTIISGGGLSINGKHVFCGDYIFSGHTMTLTLSYLVIKQYSPRNFILLHWFSFLTSLCGVLFLLIARGHYTIDVLLAYYVTTRLWWIYHTMAHNTTLHTHGDHNPIAQVFWWRIFRYFELNVVCPLPNTYSLPTIKQFRDKFLTFMNRILWSRTTMCNYSDNGNRV